MDCKMIEGKKLDVRNSRDPKHDRPRPTVMSSQFRRQILVVEDDFENRVAMVRVLEAAGYETKETDNGEDAISYILNQNIDIVLSDLHLPFMDGVELLKRAKAAADVEVILVTGYGTVEIAVEAIKEGAYDFVTKPIRNAQLLHCVEKAIRNIGERRKMDSERQFFARLVHSSSDAILTSSLDGTATSMNPAGEALFGYSAAEMIGRPGFLARLVPRERIEEAMEVSERVRQGCTVELETVRIKKNGTRCVVSLAISPIRDGLGCLLGFSEVVRDITERQRQRQRREFLAEAEGAG
jgi:PAS domain S-box-containing protein